MAGQLVTPVASRTGRAKVPSAQAPGKNQRSILGFFKTPTALRQQPAPINNSISDVLATPAEKPKLVPISANKLRACLTPAPSSDALEEDNENEDVQPLEKARGLPSPITPSQESASSSPALTTAETGSPLRKVCRGDPNVKEYAANSDKG